MTGKISQAENTALPSRNPAVAQATASKQKAKSTALRELGSPPAATLHVEPQTRTRRAANVPMGALARPVATQSTVNDIKTLMSKFSSGPQVEKIAIIMQDFILQSRKVSRSIMYTENELYMARMEEAAQSVKQQAIWALTGAALAGVSIAGAFLNIAGTVKAATIDKGGLKTIENKITGFSKKNVGDVDDAASSSASRRGSIADSDAGSHRTLVDDRASAQARSDSDMLVIVDDDATITFPAQGRLRPSSGSATGSQRTLVDSDAASPRTLGKSTDNLESIGQEGSSLTRTKSMSDLRTASRDASTSPDSVMQKAASQYDLRPEHAPFASNALARGAQRRSQTSTGGGDATTAPPRQRADSAVEPGAASRHGDTAATKTKVDAKTKTSKAQRADKLAELEEGLTPDQQKDIQNLRGLLINASMRTMTRYQASAGLTDATGKMLTDTMHSMGTYEKVEQIAEETASGASQFARSAADQMTGSLTDSVHKMQQRVTNIIESESDTRKYSIRA